MDHTEDQTLSSNDPTIQKILRNDIDALVQKPRKSENTNFSGDKKKTF